MSIDSSLSFIREQGQKCEACGFCTMKCDLLNTQSPLMMGVLIDRFSDLLAAEQIDEAAVAQFFQQNPDISTLIHRCSLCGECTLECPAGNDSEGIFAAIRDLEFSSDAVQSQPPERIFVDGPANVFETYRNEQGIDYSDLPHPAAGAGTALFFAGCPLATFAADLCRETFADLQKIEPGITFDEQCCGAPLKSAGMMDRYAAYRMGLSERLKDAGITRIIFACPHCLEEFMSLDGLQGVELVALPQVMLEQDMKPLKEKLLAGPEKMTMFDSCHDRPQRFAGPIAELVKDQVFVPMFHSGEDTRCCGADGTMDPIDRKLAERRGNRIVTEFNVIEATTALTSCPVCTQNLIHLQKALGIPADKPRIIHYLELFYQPSFNWDAAIERLTEGAPMTTHTQDVRKSLNMDDSSTALRRENG